MKELLDNGAEIDHQTKKGYTALMKASQNGYTEIVLILMDRGANLNLKNIHGATAAELARQPHITTILNAASVTK